MKIHFLCNDGSPIGITWSDIFGRGVGGAELALFSLAEELVKNGHEVTVYNNPAHPTSYEAEAGISFAQIDSFRPDEDDRILVIFRSPNDKAAGAKAIRKIWWSTDQYTVGSFASFAPGVEKIVTISPYHYNYFINTYQIPKTQLGVIDLGVRDEYETSVEKIHNRLVFCSIPDRGLSCMHAAWALLKMKVPDASIAITSDYRLWGNPIAGNHYHRLMWIDQNDVAFVGRVPRAQIVLIQKQAEIMAYPCTYDELFCISAAECQVAGAYPVTSKYGALVTTNQWGEQIEGAPTGPEFIQTFVDRLIWLMTDGREHLEAQQMKMRIEARERFSWARIAKQWENLFKTGEFA